MKKVMFQLWIIAIILTVTFSSYAWVNSYRSTILGSPIPLPDDQYSFIYPPLLLPLGDADAEIIDTKPIGVDSVVGLGNVLNVRVKLPRFSAPVDVYLGLYAPSYDKNNIYLVKPNNTLQLLSDGFVPWKSQLNTPIYQTLWGDISTDDLKVGKYYLYAMVTPVGILENYYFWQTPFEIRKPPQVDEGPPNVDGSWYEIEVTVDGDCEDEPVGEEWGMALFGIEQDGYNLTIYGLSMLEGEDGYLAPIFPELVKEGDFYSIHITTTIEEKYGVTYETFDVSFSTDGAMAWGTAKYRWDEYDSDYSCTTINNFSAIKN